MFTYTASIRPTLKSLMVSVDIKHHVYLLTGEMGNDVEQFLRFIDHGGMQRHHGTRQKSVTAIKVTCE